MKKLTQLTVENHYLDFPELFYNNSNIDGLQNPFLVSFNDEAASLIGLDYYEKHSPDFVNLLNGSFLLKGSKPFSMAYSGHQFGYFVPNLGDGRAINIGSIKGWHLQLKGAGRTKYSRDGDGRAVLRSSIREYLISEAMHALGIASTRALGIIGSEELVRRESMESAAIVLRLSSSWVRFGTFEYLAMSKTPHIHIKALADYVIAESYPELKNATSPYEALFEAICKRTATLIAKWQAVGFIHGVMNTDNMSIAGLSIDYGPFAFLDTFKRRAVYNHTDYEGRYSYGNQPNIARWNLLCLSRTFSHIVDEKVLEQHVNAFLPEVERLYVQQMQQKLGLFKPLQSDVELIRELISVLERCEIDYTCFFERLSYYDESAILSLCHEETGLMKNWLRNYKKRLEKEILPVHKHFLKMQAINPKYVLKNYMLQEAIELAEAGDFSLVNQLLEIARNPFEEHRGFEKYKKPTQKEQCDLMLSCSS